MSAVSNEIDMYLHCRKCVNEAKSLGRSPSDYSDLAVGLTQNETVQVWCQRHEMNVAVLTVDRRPVA